MADFLQIEAAVEPRGFDVALDVAQGDRIAIVGPNGAGKSTLLQLVAGSLRPTAGKISLRGEVIAWPKHHVPPHRRRVAYVEQRPLLFPHLNVVENVMFGMLARGSTRHAARKRALAELEATGIAHLAERRPWQLSGGQAQRASLARGLAIDPEIVLLDEPFAALDVSVTPELRRLLRARLQDRTVLLVSHELLDVVSLATRVIVLEHGKLKADGPTEQVVASPVTQFLADFVGLNLLHGTAVAPDRVQVGDQVIVGLADEPLEEGAKARITMPPEAISLHTAAPHGSPRNALRAEVVGVEPRGSVVDVIINIDGQQARVLITPSAVDELGLLPGDDVVAVTKATQIQLHPGG